jgi:FKBP-type peptidyl-prolyl cis-trans isomerase SlpA
MSAVRPDSFLTLHYRLSSEGEEWLSTFGMSPATVQMGSGQLAECLEHCLIGLTEGECFVFELSPEEAFGPTNPQLLERITRSALPQEIELRENSIVEFTAPSGQRLSGFLRALHPTYALFDFNHPLAGKTIRFEVDIIAIL